MLHPSLGPLSAATALWTRPATDIRLLVADQYTSRPWLSLYGEGPGGDLLLEHANALEMFRASAARAADRPMIHYFGTSLTLGEVDQMSDALAVGFHDLGVRPGDRVAVYLQNVPQFFLTVLAAWKVGATVVSCNPMLKEKELRQQLQDSGARILVALETLYNDVGLYVVPSTDVRAVVTTSELDFVRGETPRILRAVDRQRVTGAEDLLDLTRQYRGQRPPAVALRPDDIAFLTYTSGTTGPAKGAMNTHGNVVFSAQGYREWFRLTSDDVILGVSPLFHITGIVAHLAVSALLPAAVVLGCRFDAGETARMAERYRTTFTVAAITLFVALLNDPEARAGDFSSLTKIGSGGAPVSVTNVEGWKALTGNYIHHVYGMTETTSPSHAVPFGAEAPVDPRSGALSVGVPVFNTTVRIVDEDGSDMPVGEVGELVTEGPQVVPGYWRKTEETAHAMPDGRLRTGDLGFMREDGWFFVVDRLKDMIIASGYKVWPRDVEDVLLQHPAVLEAAVVGVPDEYRGETVKAFVTLRAGESVEERELITFAKHRMSAYKYPREVELVDELPKTASGKVLRRELRDRSRGLVAAT
jgi:long-chain acyl-CoA synthetase